MIASATSVTYSESKERAPRRPTRAPRVALALTGVVLVAMVAASLMGLLVDGFYGKPEATASMLRGYDLVTLIGAAPLLAVSALGVVRGSQRAGLLWLGMLAYAVYNYAIYLFGTGFNDAFLLHALAFTSAAVALGIGLVTLDVRRLRRLYRPRTPVRVVSALLGLLAVGLGAMWVAVTLQNAFTGDVPEGSTLVETDLVVHLGIALDLTLLVPAYALAAVLLWRRAAWGYALAAVLLVSGLLHQIGYLVALPVQEAADVPGATAFDPVEPFIAGLFLFGAVVMVGGLCDGRHVLRGRAPESAP